MSSQDPGSLEYSKQVSKDLHLQGIWMTALVGADRQPGGPLAANRPVIAYMQVRFLRPSAGLAMIKIIGFPGQTVPITIYIKTNYLIISATDMETVLIQKFRKTLKI